MKNQGAVPEVHQGYTDHRIVRRLPTIATDTETVGKRLVAAFGRSSNEEEAERQRLVATVQLGVEDDYRGTLLIPGTDALSALLDGDTTTHDAWATLGRGCLEIGDREKAIEALGVAIEGPELSLDLFLALAQSYREAGNLAAATRVLVTTLERYPKSGLAWGRLGAMLQLQGNHPEAEDAYAKAVALFPKDSSLLSNRAYNQLESKAVDRAIKLFKRAHDLDPLNHDASIGLADIYISQTRLDDAKVLMVRALRLDKRQTGVHINLGRIAFLEEDYLTAARHFDAAISLAAHDPMLYVERARVAEAAGDLEGARRVIEQGRARINTFEHWDKFLPKEK
jgi:Flp pilus assembly protein TadD